MKLKAGHLNTQNKVNKWIEFTITGEDSDKANPPL